MSRTGTLVDALESVAQFSRAERPHKRKKKDEQEVSEDGGRRKRDRLKKKSGSEDGKSREEGRKQAGEHSHRKSEKKVRGSSHTSSDSSEGNRRGRRSSKASREKRDRKRDRKEKRESKRRRRKESGGKHRAISSDSEDHLSDSESEGIRKPEVIAADIVATFPEVANDLKQLLEMVDSGQAVDVSGLPNKALVTHLRKLFQSLHLSSPQRDVYLLPSGAQLTSEILAPFFLQNPSYALTGNDVNGHAVTTAERETPLPPTPSVGPARHAETATTVSKRRVIGPAMPSADMLAAAARLTEAESALREAEEELENDPLVGPPPPTLVAEVESANDAERFEEVTRMVAPDVGNAYELLGVKPDVSPSILKKRYWKLSLLVHPDKCSHPQAQQAFMALNQAFKELQDPLKRAEIDRKVSEQQRREEAEAEFRAQREAAQWRRVRGEPEPGDDELLSGGPQEPSRDEWMTVLPPERQARGASQHNTFFSKTEKSGRGDTSIWTDTPADKAQKAKMQYLEAYKQAALTNGPSVAEVQLEGREKERAEKEAQLMDTYNLHTRSQSLVEKHKHERSKESKKKSKKAGKPEGPGHEREWAGNHPWKPWDREKDLTAGRQAVNLDPKKFTEGLASRFGSTQDAPRKFL